MPIFGYDVKAGTEYSSSNSIRGSKFSCPQLGMAETITVYVMKNVLGSARLKCGIYRSSDNALIGYTEEITITEGTAEVPFEGWITLNMVSGGTLEADDYYLAWWTNSILLHFYYDSIGISGTDAEPYDGFPDPWDPISDVRQHSIYCTYTPTAPPRFTLIINATMGGTTDANYPPGTYPNILEGTVIAVTAIAGIGYLFDHWELDGVNVGASSPYSLTMNADHTLTAIFVEEIPGKGYLKVHASTA